MPGEASVLSSSAHTTKTSGRFFHSWLLKRKIGASHVWISSPI